MSKPSSFKEEHQLKTIPNTLKIQAKKSYFDLKLFYKNVFIKRKLPPKSKISKFLYSLLFFEDVNLSSFCPSWDLNHSSFSLPRDVNQSSFYPSRDVNLSSFYSSGDLNLSYLNLQNTGNTLQLLIILHLIKHEDKFIYFFESLQKSIRSNSSVTLKYDIVRSHDGQREDSFTSPDGQKEDRFTSLDGQKEE